MFIKKNNRLLYVWFTCLSIVAALGNIGVIYMVNLIVKGYFASTPIVSRRYLLYFLLCPILFLASRWLVSVGIIRFTQKELRKSRLEVLQLALRASFTSIAKHRSQIYAAVTRDTDNIVTASINVVDIMTNITLVSICFIYMAFLSWQLLLCLVALTLFALLIYYIRMMRTHGFFRIAMAHNDTFVRYFNEILNGCKEIIVEPGKGKDIIETHIDKSINEASRFNQKAHIQLLQNRIIGHMTFYIFIAAAILYLGAWFGTDKAVLVNFIFLVLYVWGPVDNTVVMMPGLSQAKASIRRVEVLKNLIDERVFPDQSGDRIGTFLQLQMRKVSYDYPSSGKSNTEKPFGIGPIDFGLEKEEAVFLTGGNGSGKTTFIHILTGLLENNGGMIKVNGQAITSSRSKSYQSLFSPVFSDFHLFDQFYGIPFPDTAATAEYLHLFELSDKVAVRDNIISTIDLSAGQRKRLALIYAMLEKKPILILDEFAADQDPQFKRKFYREIIPYIKGKGFTLLAVTHDDNFYQCADRLYKMNSGILEPCLEKAV